MGKGPLVLEHKIDAAAGGFDVLLERLRIERLWRVSDHPAAAIAVNSVVAIDEQRVAGVATGDFATTVDGLYLMDLTTGSQELAHESTGSFVIGVSAYDPDRKSVV